MITCCSSVISSSTGNSMAPHRSCVCETWAISGVDDEPHKAIIEQRNVIWTTP